MNYWACGLSLRLYVEGGHVDDLKDKKTILLALLRLILKAKLQA
jgi:hypothetical protein